MGKIGAFVRYTRHNGICSALRKTVNYAKRVIHRTSAAQGITQKRRIDVMTSVTDVIHADFVGHPYQVPSKEFCAKHS